MSAQRDKQADAHTLTPADILKVPIVQMFRMWKLIPTETVSKIRSHQLLVFIGQIRVTENNLSPAGIGATHSSLILLPLPHLRWKGKVVTTCFFFAVTDLTSDPGKPTHLKWSEGSVSVALLHASHQRRHIKASRSRGGFEFTSPGQTFIPRFPFLTSASQ